MGPALRISRPLALVATSAVALVAWVAMLAAEEDAGRAARDAARRAAVAGAVVVQPHLAGDGRSAEPVLAMAAGNGAPLTLYRDGVPVAGAEPVGEQVVVAIDAGRWSVSAPVADGTAGLGLTRYSGPITAGSLLVFVSSTGALAVVLRRSRRRVRHLEERFEAVAAADESTGLGNRARLLEDLEAMGAGARRYGHRLAVVTFEIDGPHEESDVRSVAAIVAGQARTGDRCYRLPGGRFVSVLPEQDLAGAAIAAERIRVAVEATGGWTVSAGVAVFDERRDIGTTDVLDRSLAACHRAHDAGGDLLAVGEAVPV